MEYRIEFTHAAISPEPAPLTSLEIGSVVEFRGIVRQTEGSEILEGLYYEAHEEMARRLLTRHFDGLLREYPVAGVDFIHRLGFVPAGEASLYIRVASRHRAEGLCFLGEAVNLLKRDVPIWKNVRRPETPPAV